MTEPRHDSSCPSGRPPPAARGARWAALLQGVALLSAAAAAFDFGFLYPHFHSPGREQPGDPRIEYGGPLRNVAPTVGYVPDDRCAACHEDIARSYAAHPMSRSFLPAARAPSPPEDARHHNPFEALGSQYLVGRDGDRMWQRRARLGPSGRPVAELEWPVQAVIGSGARGHSYLSDRDGYLFMTPVSWYSQKEVWDLAPGSGQVLRTGRAVVPECLFCHANRAEYVDGSLNHYAEPMSGVQPIGCQRCHGPGELHVAAREQRSGDGTIANPANLEPSLRDAICEQCHLVGAARVLRRGRAQYDFRPGLPLDLFVAVLVHAPDQGQDARAVGQVEQMRQSRCYQASEGAVRLGCISCHDPHEHVASERRVEHYRARCLRCHEQHGCSLPLADRLLRSPQDSCIECHMPRYDAPDIAHTASTDHRILRNPRPATQGAGSPTQRAPRPTDSVPLVPFYRGRPGAGDEGERDLAVALVRLALEGDPDCLRSVGRALPWLEAAVGRAPSDFAAGEARGYALSLLGRQADALSAFQAVLSQAPDRESALVGAAAAADGLGQTEVAVGYWGRAVAANPWMPDYRRSLVKLLMVQQAWEKVRSEGRDWVRLDPLNVEARCACVQALLATGDVDEARTEFERVEAMAPQNWPELQARFGKKLKSSRPTSVEP